MRIPILSHQMIDDLQKLALKRAASPTIATFIEMCYRHFSKNYSVSLLEAKEKVTVQEVILSYFDDLYQEYNKEQIDSEMRELFEDKKIPIITSGNIGQSNDKKSLSDDEWVAKMMNEAKEKAKQKKSVTTKEAIESTHKILAKFTKDINTLSKTMEIEEEDKVDFEVKD